MIKKLLKYDLIATFKFWWIAALISVGLSIAGFGCKQLLSSERELPEAIIAMSSIALALIIMGLVVFIIISLVLILVRFYKNFFTDEGYLTFTLPVKCSELINSKLISGLIMMASSIIVFVLDVFIILGQDISEPIFEFLASAIKESGVYFFICTIEGFIIMVLGYLFSLLFAFNCITFASIITKKARVITAIGIYYGANSIFSFIGQLLFLFGFGELLWINDIAKAAQMPFLVTLLLGVIFFEALLCALLYLAQHYMLDRKLNLS